MGQPCPNTSLRSALHRVIMLFGMILLLLRPAFAQTYTFATLQGSPVDVTGWNLTGTTTVGNVLSNNNSEIILCTNTYNSSGGIFHTDPVDLNICARWVAEFDFRMYDGDTADGIAFCFLDVPPSGPVGGGGMGVPNSANGLKVCFDTHPNCPGEPSANLPKIEIRWGAGYYECVPNQPTLVNSNHNLDFIRSGVYNHAKIVFNNGNISVYVNGNLMLTGFQNFNFVGYFGFTSSTGVRRDLHSIKDVNIYTEKPTSNAGANISTCSNVPVTLGTANNPNYLYTWTPAAHLSSTSTSNPVFNSPNLTQQPIVNKYYVTTAFSNGNGCTSKDSVEVTVLPGAEVTVATNSTTVCSSTTVTFTATVTNAGTNPVLIWKVNGVPQNFAGNVYTTTTLQNGDVVTCEVVNQFSCGNSVSNPVSMTVNPSGPAGVAIVASANNVCEGTPITFTATPTNGGSAPVYSWFKNGVSTGTNSSTYTDNALLTGDIITVSMTSSAPCIVPAQAQSQPLVVAMMPNITPTISIASSTGGICSGSGVTFTATSNMMAASIQWYKNGQPVGISSATYIDASLNNGDVINCQATFVGPCLTSTQASSNSITMNVTTVLVPAITIAPNNATVCAGATVTFSATITNGGPTPAYQWFRNGQPVGTNSATYSDNSLTSTDQISCQLTATGPCISPNTATSNVVSVTVNPTGAPTISIVADNTSVCAGTQVNFTSTATNAGPSPVYQWMLNNVQVGGNSPTLALNAPANGDVVKLVLNSNASCASPTQATSNLITLNISPAVTPSVTIAVDQNGFCHGTTANFTATAQHAGSNPIYNWYKNGILQSSGGPTYSSSVLVINDIITCELISNAPCATQTTAQSNPIFMNVIANVTPAISIVSDQTSNCGATPISFHAFVNGVNGTLTWFLNGQPVGGHTATYVLNNPSNNDQLYCQIVVTGNCIVNGTATSNTITIQVSPPDTPSLTISSTATSVCAGDAVSFTANPVNGGSSPAYQWYKNGQPVGTNSATYTDAALANGDVISCQLTTSIPCTTSPTALSNNITISVSSVVVPALTISSNAGSVCAGDPISFTATANNPGVNPVYQWKVNGQPVAGSGNTFSSSTLGNGDQVSCELTVTGACFVPNQVTSNVITVQISQNITPAVTIAANQTQICAGSAVSFTASGTNLGSNPTYQWLLNGQPVGSSLPTFTSSTLSSTDVISLQVTATGNCLATPNASSNPLSVQVNPMVTPSVTISAPGTSICTGSALTFTANPVNGGNSPVFQWLKNGQPVGNGSNQYTDNALANNDQISCVLTSNAGCLTTATATSNILTIQVAGVLVPSVSISANTQTICAGSPVVFQATASNGGASPQYQWFVNGVSSQQTGSSFTTTTLQQGDQVSVMLQATGSCISQPTATSNTIAITVNPIVPTALGLASSVTAICAGSPVTFTASATGTVSSYQWFLNGSAITNSGSAYTTSTLVSGDQVHVVANFTGSCLSQTQIATAPIAVTVNPVLNPAIAIAVDAATICPGATANFTATGTNAGTSPVYNWFVNGTAAATGAGFSSNTLNNGDIVTAILTSNALCVNPTSATSNPITIQVQTAVQPTVTVTASQTTICSGTQVSFTASANGPSPMYQWLKNGNPVGTNSSVYTDAGLLNGDQVTCQVSFTGSCLLAGSATSTPIQITVQSVINPSVTITGSAQTLCAGSPVNYTASTMPAGLPGTIKWYKNGSLTSVTGTQFTETNPVNADAFSAIYIPVSSCLSADTAFSNVLSIQVNPVITTSATIAATATDVCAGTPVTFTVTGTGGGTSPSYNWLINGAPINGSGNVFTSSTLSNGDVVSCVFVSSASCATPAQVTTNGISMTVNPVQTPSVNIATASDTICAGGQVSFTATQSINNASPVYQWYVNQNPVGINSAQFTATNLTDGDQVKCVTSYPGICVTGPGSSNIITIRVLPMVTPAVVLSSSSSLICKGNTVLFTTLVTNGGTTPVYTWSINGQTIANSGPQFTSTTLNHDDQIQVAITGNAKCMTQPGASSQIIKVSVLKLPVISLPASLRFCEGDSVVLQPGSYSSYLWQDGSTDASFVIKTPGLYHVTVSDHSGCSNSDSTVVGAFYTKPENYLGNDIEICAYTNIRIRPTQNFAVYNWSNQSHLSYIDVTEPGTVWLEVVTQDGCKGKDSIIVKEKDCGAEVFVPDAFTPNGDGRNDVFRPVVRNRVEKYTFTVFNRWGEAVFQTQDPKAAWDGRLRGIPQPSSVFIWTCTYAQPGGTVNQMKGTVTLIR